VLPSMPRGALPVGDRADSGLLLSRWRESRSPASEVPPSCAAVETGGTPLPARSSLGALSNARGGVMSELLLDAAGRRRSPATLPDFHAGRPPRNRGVRYPADPRTTEEIVTVMRRAGDHVHGLRLRGLIVVLWRAGLRINEALALAEADLDRRRGSLLVRRGMGGRRRQVGMDDWAWSSSSPGLSCALPCRSGSGGCGRTATRSCARPRQPARPRWRYPTSAGRPLGRGVGRPTSSRPRSRGWCRSDGRSRPPRW
jgi:hypothetical protein